MWPFYIWECDFYICINIGYAKSYRKHVHAKHESGLYFYYFQCQRWSGKRKKPEKLVVLEPSLKLWCSQWTSKVRGKDHVNGKSSQHTPFWFFIRCKSKNVDILPVTFCTVNYYISPNHFWTNLNQEVSYFYFLVTIV